MSFPLFVSLSAAVFVLYRQSEQQCLYERLVAYWELDPPNRGLVLLQLAGMEDVAQQMADAGMQDVPRKLALHAAEIAAHKLVPLLGTKTADDFSYVIDGD